MGSSFNKAPSYSFYITWITAYMIEINTIGTSTIEVNGLILNKKPTTGLHKH